MEEITLVIDDEVLRRYEEHYFALHPRARRIPIAHPYHESINTWMILKRAAMNALKQRWKDFGVWFIEDQGYTNLRIKKCEMTYEIYFPTHRRHDNDNYAPKFLQDALVESGFVVDDDSEHITKLTLCCGIDPDWPRTEIHIRIEEKENEEHGREKDPV